MWLFFIICGTLLASAIWVIQRRRWRWVFRIPIITVLFLLMPLIAYFSAGGTFLGDKSWYDQTPYKELILLVLMLCGMVARYFTKAIEDRHMKIVELRKKDEPFIKPTLDFDLWGYSYPLFVSVVTFGGLLKQVDAGYLTLANAILGFQTGFFWRTLLRKNVEARD